MRGTARFSVFTVPQPLDDVLAHAMRRREQVRVGWLGAAIAAESQSARILIGKRTVIAIAVQGDDISLALVGGTTATNYNWGRWAPVMFEQRARRRF